MVSHCPYIGDTSILRLLLQSIMGTDASDFATGAMLIQVPEDDKLNSTAFYSRKIIAAESLSRFSDVDDADDDQRKIPLKRSACYVT